MDDERLVTLVQVLGKYRLGLADVEPDILGRAYEYLIRKSRTEAAIRQPRRQDF